MNRYEQFIRRYHLGRQSRVRFSGDSALYYIKFITSSKITAQVSDGAGNVFPNTKKIKDIVEVDGNAVVFAMGGKIVGDNENILDRKGSRKQDPGQEEKETKNTPRGTSKEEITKKEIEDVISGKIKVSNGDAIHAASDYIRTSEKTGHGIRNPKLQKQEEAKELKNYAIKNNIFIPFPERKNYISEGSEQKVYLIDEKNVIKLNDSVFYESWNDYFNSLLLHNYFFPDTSYKLIGFSENNRLLYSVVEQPFVKATKKTDLGNVKKFMDENGFIVKKNNDYYNKELGVILEDLHDENILTKNGVLYFVDTVFYIPSEVSSSEKMESGGRMSNEAKNSAENIIITNEPKEMKTQFKIGDTVSDSKGEAIVTKIHKPKPNTPFYDKEQYLIDIKRSNGNKAMNMPESQFMFVSHSGKPSRLSYITPNIKTFIPPFQLEAIGNGLRGEEEDYFRDILSSLDKTINEMPKTYETEDVRGFEKTAWLHYFKGGSDWYIVEKDSEPEQLQAFGYVILNSDLENAEFGYINIEELKKLRVELDLHFTPKKLSEIMDRKGAGILEAGQEENTLRGASEKTKSPHKNESLLNLEDVLNVALQDVISLDKYMDLDLAEAKVLYSLTPKQLEDNDFAPYKPESLTKDIHRALYDKDYVTYAEDDSGYALSEKGQAFVDMVNTRIETTKSVKEGTDLFPEEANVGIHQPEKVYVDIKSCMISEGDDEALFIFEGKEFTSKQEGVSSRWKIIDFFKYGITVQHVAKNKLSDKKENKKLTFDELRQLEKDGDIFIDGIDGLNKLNHCLKLLTKCIDNIDLKEEIAKEKKHLSETKKELSEIKASAKAKADKEEKNKEIAGILMELDSDTWEKLNISSGSQLYADLELQEKYKKLLDKKIKEAKITYPLDMQVHDIIEDENYHALNQYLYLSNAFGEKERDEWAAFLEKLKPESKNNFLNLHIFFPEPMPEKLTKEVLSARLKILKKMDEKNPSAVLKTRIKLINKMLSNPEKFCVGGEINGGGRQDTGSWTGELNEKKRKLLSEVDELVQLKKELYGDVDISQPVSLEEKELTEKIAAIYSEINEINREKKKLGSEKITYNEGGMIENANSELEPVTEIRIYLTGSGSSYIDSKGTIYSSDFRNETRDAIIQKLNKLNLKIGKDYHYQIGTYPEGHKHTDYKSKRIIENFVQDYLNKRNFEDGGEIPQNLVPELMSVFPKPIKEFGITEIFVDPYGEVRMSSDYDIPPDYATSIEKYVLKGYYERLLDEYDLLGVYLDEAKEEGNLKKAEELRVKMNEVELKIHKYERGYAKGGDIQEGDYIRKVENRSKGVKDVSQGFVYEKIGDSRVKLKDPYGNKSERIYDVRGFKKINPPKFDNGGSPYNDCNIDSLFKQWSNIKDERQMKLWEAQVRSTKCITDENSSIEEQVEKLKLEFPEYWMKPSFYRDVADALNYGKRKLDTGGWTGKTESVITRDGVEINRKSGESNGHVFFDEFGNKYKCLRYEPSLDECIMEDIQTGKEIVSCVREFYYNEPDAYTIAQANLNEMVGAKKASARNTLRG